VTKTTKEVHQDGVTIETKSVCWKQNERNNKKESGSEESTPRSNVGSNTSEKLDELASDSETKLGKILVVANISSGPDLALSKIKNPKIGQEGTGQESVDIDNGGDQTLEDQGSN